MTYKEKLRENPVQTENILWYVRNRWCKNGL